MQIIKAIGSVGCGAIASDGIALHQKVALHGKAVAVQVERIGQILVPLHPFDPCTTPYLPPHKNTGFISFPTSEAQTVHNLLQWVLAALTSPTATRVQRRHSVVHNDADKFQEFAQPMQLLEIRPGRKWDRPRSRRAVGVLRLF